MGLFKKKEWDLEKSDNNKKRLRELFNGVVENGDSWEILFGHNEEVQTSNYIIVRKTTYTYVNYIIGYNKEDMSIAMIETTPELNGCGEPKIFKKDSIKKARKQFGAYTIFHQGGFFAGFTSFHVNESYDDEHLVYVYQKEELEKFQEFFKEFSGK